MKKTTSYWFYLEPFVHVALQQHKNRVLLYNTLDGSCLEYENQRVVSTLCKRLLSQKNLLVVRLAAKELETNGVLAGFVKQVRSHHMGDLLDTSWSDTKPLQLMPILTIQRDVQRLKKKRAGSLGLGVLTYLEQIAFYINNCCELEGSFFREGYRQFLSFINRESPHCGLGKKGTYRPELPPDEIKLLLDQAGGSSLARIDILGGDIFRYSRFDELLEILSGNKEKERKPLKVFHCHYTQAMHRADCLAALAVLKDHAKLRILVDFPAEKEKLAEVLSTTEKLGIETTVELVVSATGHLQEAQELLSAVTIPVYSFQPYYSGKNLGFFKKYVYLKKKSVLASKPSLDDILTRQALNPVKFGRLTVLPDGGVFAGVHAPALGSLPGETFSLYRLLTKEIAGRTSWRRLRSQVRPCRDCAFNLLCPPLSDYETVIGKNNLCHIWKEKKLSPDR